MDHEPTAEHRPRLARVVDLDAAAVEHSLVNEIMALGRVGPVLARHRRQTRRVRFGDYLARPGRRAVDRSAS